MVKQTYADLRNSWHNGNIGDGIKRGEMMMVKFSPLWELTSLVAVVSLTLAACMTPASTPAPTQVPTSIPPTEIPTLTPVPIPIVVVRPPGNDEFTDIQKTLLDYAPELQTWKKGVDEFWQYWTKADIPVARPEWLTNGEIPVVLLFDPFDPENASKAWMYIDIPYGHGDCFSLPWMNGGFQFESPRKYPTNSDGKSVIETGQGPNLFIKSGMDEKGRFWYLSSAAGKPVRREVGTDKVLYQLDTAGFWVEPVNRLNEILSIVKTEPHTYVFPEYNNAQISYTLETDATKKDYPVGLNVGGFPDAERTMAWAISDAMFRSTGGRTQEEYEAFMKNGMQGTMKFKAYWDGETEPRVGEMPVPTKPIRIVFVDQ